MKTLNTPKTFIKLPAVKERTALSTSEIYRRLEAGTFPQQIRLGAKAVAWLEHEVDAWIEQTIAAGRTNDGEWSAAKEAYLKENQK